MVPILSGERVVIGLGGFLALLLLENLLSFRSPVMRKWQRYATNAFIIGSNSLVLGVLSSWFILACYQQLELHRVGLLHTLGIGPWGNALATVVWLDFMTYWWHRAYHGHPLMWRLHRVHHSDLDVDVTTSGRFHLTEMVLSAFFRLVIIALWGASFAGVVMFEIVFGFFNQFEHSNLRLPEPFETWLRGVFVTPDMHRIHHGQELAQTNSNYGTIFSVWDRWFGTYRFGDDQAAFAIGLPEYPVPADVRLGHVLAMPWGPPCGLGHGGARINFASQNL